MKPIVGNEMPWKDDSSIGKKKPQENSNYNSSDAKGCCISFSSNIFSNNILTLTINELNNS